MILREVMKMSRHAEFHSAEYYVQNIAVAQKYLNHFHLLMDSGDVCLDCCFAPSYTQKAFYLQVMQADDKFIGHCAFTYYADYWGLYSNSQSFLTAEIADKHNAKRGDVYCKIVRLDAAFINELIKETIAYIPSSSDSQTVVDGFYGSIRLFENGKVKKDILINHDSKLIQRLSQISDLI